MSGIGLVLEIIFQNEHFLSSIKPGNRNKFVWKTWKSQGILLWNFRGHPGFVIMLICTFYIITDYNSINLLQILCK